MRDRTEGRRARILKVLFFTENTHQGGLDSFFVNLVNHWPNQDDELIFICNASHPGIETIKSRLARPCNVVPHDILGYVDLVLRTERSRLLRQARRLFSPLLRVLFFLYCILKLKSEFQKYAPDRLMVINGGHPGGDSCRAAVISWGVFFRNRPRSIYNFHNFATAPRWFERWQERGLDYLLSKYSRRIISVSRACAESIYSRVGVAAFDKISWIYNGVAQPSAEGAAADPDLRMQYNFPENSSVCLMLATYEPRKGHEFLLRAFKKVITRVPSARLLIYGFGYPAEIERVRMLVDQYGLAEVVVLNEFRRDVDFLIGQSDLLLVASQAFESFGLTSVEAMARRVPVVATRVGGIPEVVADNEGGYCFGSDDVDGYANCIARLLLDSGLRKQQGERGYRRYQELFTAARMARQYADIIR